LDSFAELVQALERAGTRFVVIGVAGANYHALAGQTLFATQDFDLFLPADAGNELAALEICKRSSFELTANDEPLEEPLDLDLAERIVANLATIRCWRADGLEVDLNLVMAGFDFDEVWSQRVLFTVEGVSIPVARLEHIVRSKRTAGRVKDRLFLEAHRDELERLMKRRKGSGDKPRTDS
jgi:hypothetical protein